MYTNSERPSTRALAVYDVLVVHLLDITSSDRTHCAYFEFQALKSPPIEDLSCTLQKGHRV